MSESASKFFCIEHSEEAQRSLPFEKLNPQQKNELEQNFVGLDLDYLLLYEKTSILFSISEVNNYLKRFTEIFRKVPHYEKLYSSLLKGAWIIGELAHLRVSIATEEVLLDDEKDKIDENSSMFRSVSSRLDGLHYEHMPYTDFVEELKARFGDFSIAIFAYGQKEPIDDVRCCVESMVGKVKVEVAIAAEYNLPDYFISSFFTEKIREFSFSNFLSNKAVNVRIHDPVMAGSFARGAYRCVF